MMMETGAAAEHRYLAFWLPARGFIRNSEFLMMCPSPGIETQIAR